MNFSISLPHWLSKSLVIIIFGGLAVISLCKTIYFVKSIFPIWFPRLTNNIAVNPEALFQENPDAYAIYVDIPKEIRNGDTFKITIREQSFQLSSPTTIEINIYPYLPEDDKYIQQIELISSEYSQTQILPTQESYFFSIKEFKIHTIKAEYPPSTLNFVIHEKGIINEKTISLESEPIVISVDNTPFPYDKLVNGFESIALFIISVGIIIFKKKLGID